jgi:hypothetical protein
MSSRVYFQVGSGDAEAEEEEEDDHDDALFRLFG